MIAIEQYKKYDKRSREIQGISCWICQYTFNFTTDSYFSILQCINKMDRNYKNLYFCKKCWLKIAGTDFIIEDDIKEKQNG